MYEVFTDASILLNRETKQSPIMYTAVLAGVLFEGLERKHVSEFVIRRTVPTYDVLAAEADAMLMAMSFFAPLYGEADKVFFATDCESLANVINWHKPTTPQHYQILEQLARPTKERPKVYYTPRHLNLADDIIRTYMSTHQLHSDPRLKPESFKDSDSKVLPLPVKHPEAPVIVAEPATDTTTTADKQPKPKTKAKSKTKEAPTTELIAVTAETTAPLHIGVPDEHNRLLVIDREVGVRLKNMQALSEFAKTHGITLVVIDNTKANVVLPPTQTYTYKNLPAIRLTKTQRMPGLIVGSLKTYVGVDRYNPYLLYVSMGSNRAEKLKQAGADIHLFVNSEQLMTALAVWLGLETPVVEPTTTDPQPITDTDKTQQEQPAPTDTGQLTLTTTLEPKETTMNTMDQLHQQICQVICDETGTQGQAFTSGKFSGLGWLDFHYVCSTHDGPYPRISVKQYDKTVNVYVMLWIDGEPLLKRYTHVFGKSNLGVGCVRFKKLNPEREKALRAIVQEAMKADNL